MVFPKKGIQSFFVNMVFPNKGKKGFQSFFVNMVFPKKGFQSFLETWSSPKRGSNPFL